MSRVRTRSLLALGLCLALLACRKDMADQANHSPLEPSVLFPDKAASRPLPPHTIARGELRADEHLSTGRVEGQLVNTLPAAVSLPLLQRGRERYEIFCAPCHGRTGSGHGMIVERGFPQPPSLHEPRLREAPVGHFYEVITHGFGVMYSYASRVPPEDRWAIAAYIRTLQLSQAATLADAPAAEQAKMEEVPQ